jgi:hypothetical protein
MSRVKSYLDDVLEGSSGSGSRAWAFGGAQKAPGINQFSGSYVADEVSGGLLGGSEYYRAFRESELARMAPDVLARSVKSTWDEPFMDLITPEKPAAVSLAGYDVFGPQSFHTTTRNMTLDLRGEAAYAPNLTGDIPPGASIPSLAMGAAVNFSDCSQGCGCGSNPAGIQLPGSMASSSYSGPSSSSSSPQQKCKSSCSMTNPSGWMRNVCNSRCQADSRSSSDVLSRAGSNEDLLQGCLLDCADKNGGQSCRTICRNNFGSAPRLSKVSDVFSPAQVKSVTTLRPYHQ